MIKTILSAPLGYRLWSRVFRGSAGSLGVVCIDFHDFACDDFMG